MISRLSPHDQLVVARTQQVHDALIAVYGETECHCEQASAALVYMLQCDGVDARMVCATAAAVRRLNGRDEFLYEPHCWVRAGDLLADPTRDQFTAHRDRPLVELWSATAHLYDPEDNTDWDFDGTPVDWTDDGLTYRPADPSHVIVHCESSELCHDGTAEQRQAFLDTCGISVQRLTAAA
jgi:hypothetical protein